MKKVTDVLGYNQPQFNTVTTSTSVRDALYKMYCEHTDFLIVQDDNTFRGILTEHDVAGKVLFSEKPLQQTPVKEFMTTEVPAITADDSLEYAMQLLERYNARYLAVYEGFNFKAIITQQDLMRQTLKLRQAAFANADDQQKHSWDY